MPTWLNSFKHAHGVSLILSPTTIVTGLQVDFNTYCKVLIGAYCEVHDEPTILNTEKSRITPAIALNPTGNLQGSYHFMSLDTGKILSRRNWTELPTPQSVIDRVHDLTDKEEPLQPDDSFPDNFQFFWDLQNSYVIDAPETRVILEENEFAHEEADEASDNTPRIEKQNAKGNTAENFENGEQQH